VTVFVFGAERRVLFMWGVLAWGAGEIVAAMLPGMQRAWLAHVAGLVFGALIARLFTSRRRDETSSIHNQLAPDNGGYGF